MDGWMGTSQVGDRSPHLCVCVIHRFRNSIDFRCANSVKHTDTQPIRICSFDVRLPLATCVCALACRPVPAAGTSVDSSGNFVCSMGLVECMGHKWMSCAIDLYPKVDELIEYLAVRTSERTELWVAALLSCGRLVRWRVWMWCNETLTLLTGFSRPTCYDALRTSASRAKTTRA